MTPLISFGLAQLLRGARRGQAVTAGLGAAVMLVGLARRYSNSNGKLLFARTLKDGEGLTVRMERGHVTGRGA